MHLKYKFILQTAKQRKSSKSKMAFLRRFYTTDQVNINVDRNGQ